MALNLNEKLDDIGLGAFNYVQLLLLGGVLLSDGAEILLSSSILSALKDIWHLSPMVRALMMSIIFVGVFAGGLIGGSLADKYGRRKVILTSYVGILIFGISTALAQGPISMVMLRFFFGASFGASFGPAVALQVETSPSSWRAHTINIGTLWFTIGEIYTSVLLIVFMPDLTDPDGTQWKWVTLLSMVPGILLFPFAYFLLQESPRFLLSQGKHEEAIHTLKYIATMNNQTSKVEDLDAANPEQRLQLVRRVSTVSASAAAAAAAAASSAASSTLDNAAASLLESTDPKEDQSASSSSQGLRESDSVAKQMTVRESLDILFSEEYRSIVGGSAYLCFLGNFMFYGLTYALPQIFHSLRTQISPALQVLIVSICDIPGVFLAFFLIYVPFLGHRGGMVILAACASVLSLTLISIDHGEEWLYLGLPSAYLLKYVSSALFTLTYVYLSEVFPSKVRASGISICFAAGRIGSITAPLIVESLFDKGFKLGRHAPFCIVASALCLMAIVVIKHALHFELKNAPLEDSPSPPVAKGKDDEHMTKRVSTSSEPAPAG